MTPKNEVTFKDLPHEQHFRIPNTIVGRFIIRVMRKYLGPQYTFVLRGRILDVNKARVYERQRHAARLLRWAKTDITHRSPKAPTTREYTDTQLRRIFAQQIPWRIAKEIGVYIKHTKQAERILGRWRAQNYEQSKVYEQSRIDRIVQERVAAEMRARAALEQVRAERQVAKQIQRDADTAYPWGPAQHMAARAVLNDKPLKRWFITLYEVEHSGDLSAYERALRAVGVTIIQSMAINEDAESVDVVLDAPAQTREELDTLLTKAEVCH